MAILLFVELIRQINKRNAISTIESHKRVANGQS